MQPSHSLWCLEMSNWQPVQVIDKRNRRTHSNGITDLSRHQGTKKISAISKEWLFSIGINGATLLLQQSRYDEIHARWTRSPDSLSLSFGLWNTINRPNGEFRFEMNHQFWCIWIQIWRMKQNSEMAMSSDSFSGMSVISSAVWR